MIQILHFLCLHIPSLSLAAVSTMHMVVHVRIVKTAQAVPRS